MFNRGRSNLMGTAFALALLGFAQASGASDADNHNDNSVTSVVSVAANHAVLSPAVRTDFESVTDVNSENSGVIEEIVVIGAKKSRRSKPESSQSPDPVIKGPSRFDSQFFPVYDPEKAPLHFSHDQIDDEIRRAGFVEVFRIRFGT